MRIFQTFWTKPMSKKTLKISVYIAALSLRYAQASGYYVVMYTDTLGYSYLKDLGYDEINTDLDNIPEDVKPSQFFAYPKFFAGLKEELGTAHIDFDVFLKQPCINKFFEDKSIDIILQDREEYAPKYIMYTDGRKKLLYHPYPETLKVNHMYASNVGVIGFNNQELKDMYYSWYFDYINFYKDKLKYLIGVHSEMFAEQVNIDYIISNSSYKCFYILPVDNGKNPQLMTTIADKLGYQHLIGPGKYSEGMFAKTKEVLGKFFPDTYKLVDGLFN